MAFESREDQHNMQAALHKTWKDFNGKSCTYLLFQLTNVI